MNLICYFVASVLSLASINNIDSRRFEFGVRQITEEIISEDHSLCEDGYPINVTVLSIETPSTGIQIGPFEVKQKKTIVETKVEVDGKEYFGKGVTKTTAKSMLTELQDPNIPFEQTEFSVALKKSLEDALDDF